MGFWDGVTPQSVANTSDGGFKEFKVGDNEAYVKSIIEKESESGNPMIVIIFANDVGAEIRHYIVDGEYKLSKLKQFYIACGIPFGNNDVQSWIGKRCIVVCKPGKPYNDKVYNQVSYLRPKDGPTGHHPATPGEQRNSSAPKSSNTYQGSQAEQFAREVSDVDDGFQDDIPF